MENVDKTGAFIGSIWLKGNVNLSALLLEEGLATIHGFSADQSPHSNILYAAENRAKAIKKNVWSGSLVSCSNWKHFCYFHATDLVH